MLRHRQTTQEPKTPRVVKEVRSRDTEDNAHKCNTPSAPIIVDSDSDVPNTPLPDGAGMTAAVPVNTAVNVPQVGLEITLQPEEATVGEGLGMCYD